MNSKIIFIVILLIVALHVLAPAYAYEYVEVNVEDYNIYVKVVVPEYIRENVLVLIILCKVVNDTLQPITMYGSYVSPGDTVESTFNVRESGMYSVRVIIWNDMLRILHGRNISWTPYMIFESEINVV